MSADLLTDLMGGLQGNNNSVTEESSCRKMPSQEHFVSDECLDVFPNSTRNGRAMRLPLLSMTLVCLIPRHWSTHSRHLGYTELPRYLWIATFLLLACHAWSSSEFILQGWFTWFTPLCHWKSANDFLAQKQHRLALTRADRGDLILATCSSPEDVFAKTLSVPTPLQRLAYCVTHMN